jgi:hypothetical protein
VEDDNLLHQCEPEAGAASLGGEERTKHLFARGRVYSGSIVVDGNRRRASRSIDSRFDDDSGLDRTIGARFERVSEHVAERLTQQHVVAVDIAKFAAYRHLAAELACVGSYFVCGTLADRAEVHA